MTEGLQQLVPKESACLDGHRRIPLHVRHAMMNKFRGPTDGNYVLVSRCLKELLDNFRTVQSRTPEELECLRCFTSNYVGNKDRISRRVPGTCKWFLKNPMFLKWRQEETTLLLVTADPGCGKSVLAKALVDEDLLSSDTGNESTSICYFFFKDDDPSRQSGANALCAILHQLFVQKPTLLKYAMTQFYNHGEHIRTMIIALWSILEEAVSSPDAGRIICVLDALDECGETAKKDLITRLSNFYCNRDQLKTKLKFLVTSRPYSNIERAFQTKISDMTSISLRGEDETDKISAEIDLVIDHKIPQISKNRRYPLEPEVQNALIKSLKSIPHRTYLWLYLILDVIQESLDSTKTSLERLVNKIPHTVEDAYEKILTRINSSDLARQARTLLHMIAAAAQPLSVQEVNIALAIDDKLDRGETCHSFEDLDVQPEGPFREKLRNCCGLFVNVIDSKVYLLHQTAKEFLVSNHVSDKLENSGLSSSKVWRHSLKPVESNFVLVKICVSYLLLEEFERGIDIKYERFLGYCSDIPAFKTWGDVYNEDENSEGIATLQGLLDYAARYWLIHFRKAHLRADKFFLLSMLKLCDAQSNRFWRWSLLYSEYFRIDYLNQSLSNLMVTTYCGLEALVKMILETDVAQIESQDCYGRTPLSLAAWTGHFKTVKLLLEWVNNGVELNAKDRDSMTALSLATESGYSDVVKLLLEQDGIEFNTMGSHEKRTPLLEATIQGNSEIVMLLLAKDGIDLSSLDCNGMSPLGIAAYFGRLEIFKLLLDERGIDRNLKDKYGRTPLASAALEGHLVIVKLLISKADVDHNLGDENGRTPLANAASKGHLEIVKLLISKTDIKLNTRNRTGQTPLMLALHYSNSEVAKLLLMTDGVIFNRKGLNGDTPLILATLNWQLEVVDLLLKKDGIELNATDGNGQTALSLAVRYGEHDTVKLLLDKAGVEPNHRDAYGQWIISIAVYKNNPKVVRLLLERGANINVKDGNGSTPLLIATKRGMDEVVGVLEEFSSSGAHKRSAGVVTEEDLPPPKHHRI